MLILLSHYYFLIFAFFMSACYVCWRLIRKEWGKALKYEISVWSGLGVGVLLFPALLRHIVEGNKGRETISNLLQSIYIFRWRLQVFFGKDPGAIYLSLIRKCPVLHVTGI